MRAFHVICGLPRSGSTLLCNILAQNPAIEILHTSPLPSILDRMGDAVTDTPEIKGLVAQDVPAADARTFAMLEGAIQGFHSGTKRRVVIDKSRLWNNYQFALEKLFPDAKMIVCLRDLRAVFGSNEKRWRRNPMMFIPPGRTMRDRMENQFSPGGLVGSCLNGVEDLWLTQNPRAFWLFYERFVENPKATMQAIYQHLGEPVFEHDFDDVKNTAIDPDAIYLGKFPHKGEGKVEAREGWQQFVPELLAQEIAGSPQFPHNIRYMQRFGYV